ncbi:MAG: DUF3800 domain-containing protein [Herbiconiux sp.]|nr:DUF3800 domain-containing protein [Herbiconiux sp.]
MPPHLTRLIYVDDSGHPATGLVVYGWVEFAPDRWAAVLDQWLQMRRRLWRECGIPVSRELHATDFVNGRGKIAARIPARHVHGGTEHWKDFGREVAESCLETLRSTEGLTVGAVFRHGPSDDVARTRREAYGALIRRFEAELECAGALGLVFMDGDGTDEAYRAAHRDLGLVRRHVIEDALHLDSAGSHLVQMADLVAWSANAAIGAAAKNRFAWDWYRRFLSERDPRRSPEEV